MFKLCVPLYYLICIGYAILVIKRRKENGLIKALIITFLPVLGFALLYYFFKTKKSTPRSQAVEAKDEHEQFDHPDHIDITQLFNIEEEINLVPIQDALILNDNRIKRKLLIHSLKENSVQNTKVLEMALQNEDSETSHYAASAIMEMKRKLQNSVQDLARKLEENPEDIEIMSAYADVISQYLKSGFLDEGAYTHFLSLHSSILERILTSGYGQKIHFIDKINSDLKLRENEKAAYYSEKFLEEFPHDEMSYIMAMKLHYSLRNPKQLQRVLSSLKKQPVRLSPQGLNIVRFWL